MRNTFSIEIDHGDEYDVRLWIIIDGQKRFQLAPGCLEDSIFSPDGVLIPQLKWNRKSPLERIIDYGFCEEVCCPSKFATVRVGEDSVTWTGIRESTSEDFLDPAEFEFERTGYEAEINRVLIALVRHYKVLYSRLKWPQP